MSWELSTIPSLEQLAEQSKKVPDYMRPNLVPTAVVISQFLDDRQCDEILYYMMEQEPYEFKHCGATTREAPRPMDYCFSPLIHAGHVANEQFFGFDLDEDYAAWMQTYERGDDYQKHTDAAPGQMRKLTAVLMLSDEEAYSGGDLRIEIVPRNIGVNRTRGTVVVFPSWVQHYVTPVKAGVRQTINLGFWGPNFK